MKKFVLIGICLLFLAIIIGICKSKFTESKSGNTPSTSKFESITDDTVLIFYAPWCGHCKKSMPEFITASEQGNGKVMLFNSDDPDTIELLKKYSVRGFPTIMKASGEMYNGQRYSKDILEFVNN